MSPRSADFGLPCGILRIDDQRVIVEANEETAKVLHRTVATLVGRRLTVILPIASRVFFQTHVFPELALRGSLEEIYVTLQTSGGHAVPVIMSGRRLMEEGGTSYVFAFLSTRRREVFGQELVRSQMAAEKAEEAEEQARARLREYEARMATQERLAWLGTLAAGIAHEINNPLTFVLGNLELVQQRVRSATLEPSADDAGLATLLDETRDGADRIRRIVRSLQSLSRPDDLRVGPVDLQSTLNTAMRLSAQAVRGRCSVIVQMPEVPPAVQAEEGRLVQVFVNLLVNAAQAMPARPASENRVVVRCRQIDALTVEVEVEDNGAGIASAHQKHIFDPFYTTKPAGVGTGLGLSVCQTIVAGFGGSIRVVSVEGEGTVFQVALPLASAHVQERAAPEAASSPLGGATTKSDVVPTRRAQQGVSKIAPRRYRALLVDDEPAILKVLTRVLRDYEVYAADSADEVYAYVDAGETFDVILCDMMLNGCSGVDIYERLAQTAPALARRMVFMSGGTFGARAQKFLEQVDNPRLEKPFRFQAVLAVCREVCARAADDRATSGTG